MTSHHGKKKAEYLWDPVLEPLVSHLLASNEVRIRPAVEVGKKAVDYCRGGDLMRWIIKNESVLRSKFPKCFDDATASLTQKDAETLGEQICRAGFFYKAHYKPISDNRPADSGNQTESTVPKWPKRLEMSKDQKFDVDYFYILRYEPKSHWPYIYLAFISGAVLAICLFPAWPLALKLTTWYISVCLMTFMLGSIVIRLVLFLAFWFFGIDFWFFPNLFDEERGVIDSFRPLYSFEKRQDDWAMLAARIFLAILIAGAGFQLSRTHSLSDVHRFAAQQFLDVLDWGHQKLAAPPAESSVPIAKFPTPGLGADPTDGFRCMQPCGFESYEVMKEECLFDCLCMKELMESHCIKKCPEAAKQSLEASREEACQNEVLEEDDDEL